MALKDRIQEAMDAAKKTAADLARATGKTPGAVSQWLDGTTKSIKGDTAAALQLATGFSATWLATGKGPKKSGSNVEAGPEIRGAVPLISWVQAGSWSAANDPLQPGEAERWMACLVPHSEGTYALRVKGDSMTAPHGNTRSYPEGSYIFVDPAKRSPVNGDRIVAKLEGEDAVTFKVYKNEDGRQWLHPLNPAHDPIRQPFSVLGTVIGKWEDG